MGVGKWGCEENKSQKDHVDRRNMVKPGVSYPANGTYRVPSEPQLSPACQVQPDSSPTRTALHV